MDALQKKINAYNKAFFIATKRKNYNKSILISNKLIVLDRQYYNNLKNIDISYKQYIKRKSKVPAHDYIMEVYWYDVIIKSFFLPSKYRKRFNQLIRKKVVSAGNMPISIGGYTRYIAPCFESTLPIGTFYDRTKQWYSEYNPNVKHLKRKKIPDKKSYLTVVTRDKTGRIKRTTKIEKNAYADITILKKRNLKTPIINITKKDNITYRGYSNLDNIIRYFDSITDKDLYREQVKTRVLCNKCNAVNTLKTLDNRLACSKCGHFALTSYKFKVRFFYFNPFIRYKLNELTNEVTKQIETSRGFKTIYKGKLQ